MKRITTAIASIATPATDRALRKRYNAKGKKAFNDGLSREFSGDPNSLIGGWWFEGYDTAAAKNENKND